MSAGFFAVFDDIASLLNNTAAMSKIAAKKTAGVLGDDLAVGAEKASGFSADREIPVLWAISKGSFKNKLLILPAVFLLSAFASWLIIPILMLGGLYLAYEGAEKIYDYFFHNDSSAVPMEHLSTEALLKYEAKKVKSAILTDFILSIEIIIIAMSTVIDESLMVRIIVVSLIAMLATIGVYGIVALLVRMDDIGFKMIEIAGGNSILLRYAGELLVQALPRVIYLLSIIGTLAMLLVAGGIYVHNSSILYDFLHNIPAIVAELVTGLVLGIIVLGLVKLFSAIKQYIQHG